ncbi:unnamed protein product, partial [Didymodactylos carnosus]
TDLGDFVAEFGMHDRYIKEESKVIRFIKQVIIHPFYRGSKTRWEHDIALLQLSESLQLNSFIRTICLPNYQQELVHVNEEVIITGWGDTRGTGDFRYLRQVSIPIQSTDQCGLNSTSSHNSVICGGLCNSTTCDSCQGDSGGPMIKQYNNRWYLAGLISWGYSCAGLGIYTKVSQYSQWIQELIRRGTIK